MAKLEKVEYTKMPNVRIIGREVTHEGKKNPVPALWKQIEKDGTLEMLKKLPLAISGCSIGWMGDAKDNTFKYIAGVIAVEDTPVPEGMQYRDLPACDIAKGYLDRYQGAHNLVVKEINANGLQPDYSFGWSAEVYPEEHLEDGIVNYFCPYKK